MTYDAFISYSSPDKAIADAMCHFLEQRKLRCWIAPRDVPPGEDYAAAIIDAITRSRSLVVIFTSHANASKHVKNEVERAASHGVPVIPFRTEDVQPSRAMELFLGAKHWLDAMSPPLEPYFARLADHLAFLAGQEGFDSSAREMPATATPSTVAGSPGPRPARRFSLLPALLGAVGVAAVLAGLGLWQWGATKHGTSAEPLGGMADVLVWNPQDGARRGLGIRDALARPMRRTDQIRVQFAMNRPAYVYLVWVGEDGKVAPLYPWRPGDWRNRPSHEEPIDHLSLPPEVDRAYPMGGTAGMQSIVLLARETPLPAHVDLEHVVGGLQPQPVQNAAALVEFDGGRPVSENTRAPQFFNAQRIDDPLLQNQQLLAERLGTYFPLIRAVSFASSSEEGPNEK